MQHYSNVDGIFQTVIIFDYVIDAHLVPWLIIIGEFFPCYCYEITSIALISHVAAKL